MNSNIAKNFFITPYIDSLYDYVNVNKDKDLRKKIVNNLYNKLLNWIENDIDFSKLKNSEIQDIKNEKKIKNILYRIVKSFVTKKKINWWDINKYRTKIKKYIRDKLYL